MIKTVLTENQASTIVDAILQAVDKQSLVPYVMNDLLNAGIVATATKDEPDFNIITCALDMYNNTYQRKLNNKELSEVIDYLKALGYTDDDLKNSVITEIIDLSEINFHDLPDCLSALIAVCPDNGQALFGD